jgi:hypothetical protein
MAAAGRAGQNDEPLVETLHAAIEAREGRQLKVVFAAEGQPALLFKPGAGSWNWSATSKLVIPIDNPGDAVVALLVRVASDPERSLSGKVAIAPHSMGELAIRIDAPPPRAMGMIAGPTLAAGGLEPGLLPVTATEGSVDASHVASVRLGISRPTAPRHLVIGPLRAEPPSTADKNAYDGIVDGFGQFRHGTWPEKISSVGVLRAGGAEEALELIGWLAHAPKRDRFGGLDTSGSFRATGFFRTERRAGRWWLVTPDGNPFFTIGMDVLPLPMHRFRRRTLDAD